MQRARVVFSIVFVVLSSFPLLAGGVQEESHLRFRDRILSEIKILQPGILPPMNQGLPEGGALREYVLDFSTKEFMGLTQWSLGRLVDPRGDLGVCVIKPQPEVDKKTVVLFFHGYVSHLGNYMPYFKYLADNGYTVVAADLPGHGLSGGAIRGDVSSFNDYGDAVGRLLDWVVSIKEWQAYRRVGSGHSTGALAFFDYCSRNPGKFDRLILGAPLVKTIYYVPAMLGYGLIGWIGSWGLGDLGDRLSPESFPMHWLKALFEWNDRAPAYPMQPGIKVLFIRGDEDTVVEVEKNIAFLQAKFPQNQVLFVKGMGHMVYQQEGFREKVWAGVVDFLRE